MRAILFALGIGLAACASAPSAPPAPLRAPLEGAERIEPPSAHGYATSRDGASFLFSADPNGTMNAFVVALEGEDNDPRPLTTETSADTIALSYFPNDDRILLTMGAHLYVRAQDGGLSGLGRLNFLGWSGDGSAFYAASTDTIYAFDTGDFSRETLHSGANIEAALVSRDRRWIATRTANTITLVDRSPASAGAKTILADETGEHALFEFSSSGRSLVYGLRASEGFMHARRYDLASGETYPVMEAQSDVMSVVSTRAGRHMVLETWRNGAVNTVTAIDQQEDRAIPLRGYARDVRFNRDDSRVFFRLADDGWPQDIFVSELDGEEIHRLVHSETVQR